LAFENRNDYLNVINIKNNMNKNRQDFDNYILPKYEDLSPYWLVGFVEGDGCFCINKMKAQFYLIQKDKKNLNLISRYLVYISNKEKLINFIDNSSRLPSISFDIPKVRVKKNVNPVNVLTIGDQDIIFQFIAPFFANRQMLTRKGFDFYIWLICVFLIIYGYSKTLDGKKLMICLSKNMNNARYSNNNLVNDKTNFDWSSLYILLKKVLSKEPPFNIYSRINHKNLVEKYKSSANMLQKNTPLH